MPQKIAKYKLPHKEADLDTLVHRVRTYCTPHLVGSNPDWPDIPTAAWTAFTAAVDAWDPAYEACKVPHVPSQTAAKNLAEDTLRDALRNLINRGLLLPPRTLEDVVAMGFQAADIINTPDEEIKDLVDIDLITNGTVPGTHVHIVHYRIAGHPTRAKDHYQLAVFQVYLRGPDDPAPVLESEAPWGPDHLSKNEPFEIHYGPERMGWTAYYRARWQAFSSAQGPWTMSDALIP